MVFSDAYVQHAETGPFPQQVDPWVEAGKYFQQLHSEIISQLLTQLHKPLIQRGYVAGRESSLQIAENREPDVYILRQNQPAPSPTAPSWDYATVAATLPAPIGVMLEDAPYELDALHLKSIEGGELVTVVEIISPRNKTESAEIEKYQARRGRLLAQGVNVLEIDLTRSYKRLIQDRIAQTYPYHVAVHLCDQPARFIGIGWKQALPVCAIPLRQAVIGADLHLAYTHGYRQTSLALQIYQDTQYQGKALPFPTLLTAQQLNDLVEQSERWKKRLAELRQEV